MSKKQWYVVADAKGLQIYKNCNTKADAEQLCKNLQRLFNPSIIFWVDFVWKSENEKSQHGNLFVATNNIISACGEYINNCCISWC